MILHELKAAPNDAESDTDVNIVVKAQERVFSAGFDPQSDKNRRFFDDAANRITSALRQCNFPVLGQPFGACLTDALEIARSCDFILTYDGKKLSDAHANWALRSTWSITQNLAQAVGAGKARQLSFSAAVFSGAEATDRDLTNESLGTPEALEERAQELAQPIAKVRAGGGKGYKKPYEPSEIKGTVEHLQGLSR